MWAARLGSVLLAALFPNDDRGCYSAFCESGGDGGGSVVPLSRTHPAKRVRHPAGSGASRILRRRDEKEWKEKKRRVGRAGGHGELRANVEAKPRFVHMGCLAPIAGPLARWHDASYENWYCSRPNLRSRRLITRGQRVRARRLLPWGHSRLFRPGGYGARARRRLSRRETASERAGNHAH
jgi:hypothetical protein